MTFALRDFEAADGLCEYAPPRIQQLSLMLKEIAEQPAALAQTIKEERSKIARLGKCLKERDIDLITFCAVARGSGQCRAVWPLSPWKSPPAFRLAVGTLGPHPVRRRETETCRTPW
jgi:hypothetical protein